jgi:predicted Rossmann-fold nucleotide-binding protein
VKHHLNVVYGGGSIGLMGLAAKTVLNGGGKVVGIIPHILAPADVSGTTVGEVMIVDSKLEMIK